MISVADSLVSQIFQFLGYSFKLDWSLQAQDLFSCVKQSSCVADSVLQVILERITNSTHWAVSLHWTWSQSHVAWTLWVQSWPRTLPCAASWQCLVQSLCWPWSPAVPPLPVLHQLQLQHSYKCVQKKFHRNTFHEWIGVRLKNFLDTENYYY